MKIYNTFTKTKEEFTPIERNKVKIYSCGPTVYNFIHIGNARPLVVFDTVCRYLEYKGYEVLHVQNFTDVDDKIINKANEEGVSADVISERYIKEALADEKGLNIVEPFKRPKVTEEMDSIIDMVNTLIEKGVAYEKNGTVYYNTNKFSEYGKLSRKNIEDLEAGSRVEVDGEKVNPTDFVLWKPAKPGEPKWKSPWGEGRPGWHIECSAMVKRYLGDTIDIHTGGEDLIFPHHENEVAQSEAANGKPFAKIFMHNGFLNVDNKKMSKSLGNFFTLREITEKFSYDVVRFFFISAHYRMPINFSDELLQASENGLNRILNGIEKIKFIIEKTQNNEISLEEKELISNCQKFMTEFETAMDDDFNTADAVTALFELIKFANINVKDDSSKEFAKEVYDTAIKMTDILGLRTEQKKETGDSDYIEKRIEERQAARKNKDFKTADAIRDELSNMGVVLEDTSAGVRWSYK